MSNPHPPRRRISRRLCRWGAGLTVVGAILAGTGCGSDLKNEFTTAAVGGLETGIKAIVNALLDGLFAVATPKTS
jgi:hypothetical protein